MNWKTKKIKIDSIEDDYKLELPVSSGISYNNSRIEDGYLYVHYLDSGFEDVHVYNIRFADGYLGGVIGYTLLTFKEEVAVFCKLVDLLKAK